MGKLEERNKKKLRRENLQRIILQSVATAGILSVGLVAPNVIGAMNKLGLLPKIREKEYVSSSAAKLVRRGLLEFKGRYYQLTKEGEKVLRKWELADYSLRKPKKWDEKWRVVIFDVPEKYKSSRERFRRILQKAGFLRLQDSVWVHPYECEELVTFMRKELKLGGSVLYLIVEGLEGETKVREYFKL